VLAQDQRGAKALWYTLLPVGKHTRAEALGGHESGGWGQLAVPACALSTPALSPRPGACPHTARASAIVHTCRGRMDCMYVVSGRLAFWSAQTHALRSYNHTTTVPHYYRTTLLYHTAVPHCSTTELLYYRTALLQTTMMLACIALPASIRGWLLARVHVLDGRRHLARILHRRQARAGAHGARN